MKEHPMKKSIRRREKTLDLKVAAVFTTSENSPSHTRVETVRSLLASKHILHETGSFHFRLGIDPQGHGKVGQCKRMPHPTETKTHARLVEFVEGFLGVETEGRHELN